MKKTKMILRPSPDSLQGKTVTMINHALKGIKYHIQIRRLQNIRGKLANKYQIQESQKTTIQGLNYKDILNCVCQSEQDGQTILDQIQFCYQNKCRKNQILISKAILFTEECLQFFTNPENVSQLSNILIEIYITFIQMFKQFKLLAEENYEALFQYYPIKFLIDGLEKFREFYAYILITEYSFSQFLIVNSLLCNFILGVIQQDIFINGNKIANSFHITGLLLTINSLNKLHMPRRFSKQKWKNLNNLIQQKNIFAYTIHRFVYNVLKSKPISQIIIQFDNQLSNDFFLYYYQKIFCIFIPFWNIKGFATDGGLIFINIYPVIKEFNVSIDDLQKLIKQYCLIVVIIALDRIRNLNKWKAKIMPIESIISTSEFSHLELYQKIFGLNDKGVSNLKLLNIQTMMIIQQLETEYELNLVQLGLAKTQQDSSVGDNLRFLD